MLGLYAAGACTGGLEGGPVAGYIGGLCKALTMGWIAAASIAADLVDAR
jgi:fumarate reductase flavoprotein subunit